MNFPYPQCVYLTLQTAAIRDTNLILNEIYTFATSGLLEASNVVFFLFLCVSSAQNKTGI
jgi:hypothetical protein